MFSSKSHVEVVASSIIGIRLGDGSRDGGRVVGGAVDVSALLDVVADGEIVDTSEPGASNGGVGGLVVAELGTRLPHPGSAVGGVSVAGVLNGGCLPGRGDLPA